MSYEQRFRMKNTEVFLYLFTILLHSVQSSFLSAQILEPSLCPLLSNVPFVPNLFHPVPGER